MPTLSLRLEARMRSAAVRWLAIVVLLLAVGENATGQERSPVQDLLGLARAAINDLRYEDADSITRAVLALDGLRRSDRIQALQLRAGALFPEQEPAQRRSDAEFVLAALVRIAPSANLPREVVWPGLEALLQEVRSRTFGISALPREHNVLDGPDGAAEITVAASRRAFFRLWLEDSDGGGARLIDSLFTATGGTLRLRVLQQGVPSIPAGRYRLVVTAEDLAGGETMRLSFAAEVDAPALEYVPIPGPLGREAFLPEVTRPKRTLGVVAGVLVLAGTVAGSRVLRETELRNVAGADGRAVMLGIVLGGGAVAGVWLLDKGEPVPANIAANREARAAHEQRVADAHSRNAQLLRSYQAEVTVDPEPLP
jgi:hypothetical protein